MSAERVYPTDNPELISDWAYYAGVKMPRYLITQNSFEKKLGESSRILDEVKAELEKGTSTEDAGDTHGQYHNEYAWYREQSLSIQNTIGAKIGQNLDRAVIVPDYDKVRENLTKLGVNPSKIATLSSKMTVLYQGDDTPEEIMLVSLLDGNQNPGWVSLESPLGVALQGHSQGEDVFYKLSQKNTQTAEIKVKIITIS